MRYEIYRENINNWSTAHVQLEDQYKYQILMESLRKNNNIKDLSKYAASKISEELRKAEDQTIDNAIKILDKKYKKTRSEVLQDMVENITNFKTTDGETGEQIWDKFSTMRSFTVENNMKNNIDSILLTMFCKICKSSKVFNEVDEHTFRDIIENTEDNKCYELFEKKFRMTKIIGNRTVVNEKEEKRSLNEDNKIEDVNYGKIEQDRGRNKYRQRKFYRSDSKPNLYRAEWRSKSRSGDGRSQSTGRGRFKPSEKHQGYYRSRSQSMIDRKISPLEQKVDTILKKLEDISAVKLVDETNIDTPEVIDVNLAQIGSQDQYMLVTVDVQRQ